MALRQAFCLLVGCLGLARAAPLDQLELQDGSVIAGELLGVANGVYRLRSPILGTVEVNAAQVRALRPAGAAPPTAATADSAATSAALARLQARLEADPALMQQVLALQNDPTVRQALADPSFLAAVGGGNLAALRDHPHLRALLAQPQLRALVEQLAAP